MKKVLIVHDISCYGKCSTTVALPILSAMELTGVILPTSILSNHTAAPFHSWTFLDLTEEMKAIVEKWKEYDVKFDAVYVGYLGKIDQISFLEEEIPKLLKPEGKFYLDPVMADGGKFYAGFDQAYAEKMKDLCAMADLVMPNQTEASFIYGLPYKEGIAGLDQVDELIQLMNQDKATDLILTGVGKDDKGKTGAYYYDAQSKEGGLYQDVFVGGAFHGTGDIFGSIAVGAMENGAGVASATKLAVEALPRIIRDSVDDPNVMKDGLQFERSLPDLGQYVRRLKAEGQA